MTDDQEWQKVWSSMLELSEGFDDFILIGGVAVYLHLTNRLPDAGYAIEFSHDVDAYISLADFSDMRDIYVVTPNKRLNKQQVNIGTTEVDLYVEHNHRLAIPYGEMQAHQTQYGKIKVACLEHLLILKSDAAQDRWGTEKGDKDARDVARIVWIAGNDIRTDLLTPYLNDDRRALLNDVVKKDPFLRLAKGNMHLAKPIKQAYDSFLAKIKPVAESAPSRKSSGMKAG